ncbi:MAG: DUF4340 domain-containing protein [Verrucomicrobia bacterium]|nr:DUF4340 domain-containing protein [Verrucomicrobiota bacterium]NBU08280.1 DUF4340 domain-containing protein [Pseudomonadota bacterium]NDA66720.1 DUF4340 domain-containing protein [Verrucomicrobiota bacterium]NDB75784.1 DUF4340 domain-containing protein [Verrucomicrobiota bacterium]NDD38607.1 DUF4340 domain-containing protein [Verrucomicrobiota bacterium]
MNRKQFLTLLVLVAVIGGAGLLVNQRRQGDWQQSSSGGGQKLAGSLDVNAVAAITIKSTAGELNLVKSGDAWVVKERGDYAANFNTIADLIRKFADVKAVQTEQIGASQHARLELQVPGEGEGKGTLVELKGKDGKALKGVVLGKKQTKKSEGGPFGGGEFPVGRWVRDTASKDTVIVTSEQFADAEPKPENWLEKDFLKVEHVKSIAVSYATNAASGWKVTRETEGAEWKLADVKAGENVDTNKLSALGSPLNSPSFSDVVANPQADKLGLDKPATLVLETFDGFTYTAKAGTASGDNYPFQISVAGNFPKARKPGRDEKPEDKDKLDKEFAESQKKLADKLAADAKFSKWTYLVSKWTLDSVLKSRADFFVVEKKDESKPNTK